MSSLSLTTRDPQRFLALLCAVSTVYVVDRFQPDALVGSRRLGSDGEEERITGFERGLTCFILLVIIVLLDCGFDILMKRALHDTCSKFKAVIAHLFHEITILGFAAIMT